MTTLVRQRRNTKKPTNLSLGTDILAEARALDLNLSQTCDALLRDFIRKERERRWRDEYADFVAAYNKSVATDGLPLQEWKSF
jgi:antitoxin CcdA